MTNFSFTQIDKARKLLGLPQEATLKEIKEAYYTKAKEHHPDKHADNEKLEQEREMAQINRAHKTLLHYIDKCKFSFTRESVEKNDPEQNMRKRFSRDWLCE